MELVSRNNNISKRFACIVLCLLIVTFTCFMQYQEAHAIWPVLAAALAPETASVVTSCLIAAGIAITGVAADQAISYAVDAFWYNCADDIKQGFINASNAIAVGLRNMCLLALMIDCGLRRNEALELDYDNVHISQGIIKVLGKGQKERIVPIGLYTKKLLITYISGVKPTPLYETKRLFLDRFLKPLTENGVKELFNRIKKKTGITRLHPHILRHTFATKYIMNGGDIISLQQILGHTSLEMVKKYSHLASGYLMRAHHKFAPLDNIERKKYLNTNIR